MSTWTPPSLRSPTFSLSRDRGHCFRSSPRPEHPAADPLPRPVVRLRVVVTAPAVRADDAAEPALPRLLLAQGLPEERGPSPAGPFGATRAVGPDVITTLVHLSLPFTEVQLAGGDANPHTFRSESRRSATALRPLARGASARREDFTSTPLPVGSIRSSDASASEASASALAAFGLCFPVLLRPPKR